MSIKNSNFQVKEINPCPDHWHDEFLTNMLPKIRSNHDFILHVIRDHREMSLLKASLHHTVYESPRRFLDMYNILDSTPYYYIKYLLDTDPSCILDIGCGKNVFKKSFPALLIGMDSGELCDERTLGSVDIVKKFDSEFVEQNQKMYPAVMSINAIHFAPIHSITQRLDWIKQLVRAKGRAFVTFNIETWLMFTDRKTIESIFGNVPQWEDVVNYVNQQILAANLDFLVVDWPVLHISKHSGIRDNYNGNVRLVFQVD